MSFLVDVNVISEVTRNVKDFGEAGVAVVNPFD